MILRIECICLLSFMIFIITEGDGTSHCSVPPFECTMIPKDEFLWAYPEWQIVGTYSDLLLAYDRAKEIAIKIPGGSHSYSIGTSQPNVTTWKGWVELNQLKTRMTPDLHNNVDTGALPSLNLSSIWLIITERTYYNQFIKTVTSDLPDNIILLVCRSHSIFEDESENLHVRFLDKKLEYDPPTYEGMSDENPEPESSVLQEIFEDENSSGELLLPKIDNAHEAYFKNEVVDILKDFLDNGSTQVFRPDIIREFFSVSMLPNRNKLHHSDESTLAAGKYTPLKNLDVVNQRAQRASKVPFSPPKIWMKNREKIKLENRLINALQIEQFDYQRPISDPRLQEKYLAKENLFVDVDIDHENSGYLREDEPKIPKYEYHGVELMSDENENHFQLLRDKRFEADLSNAIRAEAILTTDDDLSSCSEDVSCESNLEIFDGKSVEAELISAEDNDLISRLEDENSKRDPRVSDIHPHFNSAINDFSPFSEDVSLKYDFNSTHDDNSARSDLITPDSDLLSLPSEDSSNEEGADSKRLPLLGAAGGFDEVVEKFVSQLQVDKAKQEEIFEATLDQNESERWHKERKYRLTASTFGVVYNWTDTTEKLIYRLLYSVPSNTTGKRAALNWGHANERRAADDYANQYQVKVERSGLIVDLQRGFLAASPDGLIGNDTLCEIKCPYFLRNANLTAIIQENDLFCCTFDRDRNQVRLNRNHYYYYQMQGQMGISGRHKGVFILWSPRGFLSETIDFDPELWKNMTIKLEEFYKTHIVPEFIYNYHRYEQTSNKREL